MKENRINIFRCVKGDKQYSFYNLSAIGNTYGKYIQEGCTRGRSIFEFENGSYVALEISRVRLFGPKGQLYKSEYKRFCEYIKSMEGPILYGSIILDEYTEDLRSVDEIQYVTNEIIVDMYRCIQIDKNESTFYWGIHLNGMTGLHVHYAIFTKGITAEKILGIQYCELNDKANSVLINVQEYCRRAKGLFRRKYELDNKVFYGNVIRKNIGEYYSMYYLREDRNIKSKIKRNFRNIGQRMIGLEEGVKSVYEECNRLYDGFKGTNNEYKAKIIMDSLNKKISQGVEDVVRTEEKRVIKVLQHNVINKKNKWLLMKNIKKTYNNLVNTTLPKYMEYVVEAKNKLFDLKYRDKEKIYIKNHIKKEKMNRDERMLGYRKISNMLYNESSMV